jgi:hypothetical protein
MMIALKAASSENRPEQMRAGNDDPAELSDYGHPGDILIQDNMDEQQAIQRFKNGDIDGLELLVLPSAKAMRTAICI